MRSEIFAKYKRKDDDAAPQMDIIDERQLEDIDVDAEYSPAQKSSAVGSVPLTEYSSVSNVRRGNEKSAGGEVEDTTDWDEINAQQERARLERENLAADAELRGGSGGPSRPLTFKEAYTSLRTGTTWQKYVTKELKRVADSVKTTGFWGSLWSCWHTDIVEGSDEYEERDFILALQFVSLDHSDPLHQRMLITIFRKLTKPPRTAPDPATYGSHWERLGFQGTDPGTDLRSTGLLGLLQILYLIDFFPVFASALFQTATNPLTEVPFVLVCFNYSAVCMESLKERGLHDDIAVRAKQQAKTPKPVVHASVTPPRGSGGATQTSAPPHERSVGGTISTDFDFVPPPVTLSVCSFFVGALFSFLSEWKKQSTRSVTDFGPIKARLRMHVRHHVSATIALCDVAKDRKKINDMLTNRSSVHFSSTSGKEDDKEFMEF